MADLVGGHWWHAAFTLLVAALITGVVNAVITAPFGAGAWFVQGVAAAAATIVTLPYGALVGVLLYLDVRARKDASTSTPSRPTCRPRRPDLQVMLKARIEPRWSDG